MKVTLYLDTHRDACLAGLTESELAECSYAEWVGGYLNYLEKHFAEHGIEFESVPGQCAGLCYTVGAENADDEQTAHKAMQSALSLWDWL